MAKPCKLCIGLLKKAVNEYGINIKKVSYSLNDGTFESCLVGDLKSDFITSGSRRILFEGQSL